MGVVGMITTHVPTEAALGRGCALPPVEQVSATLRLFRPVVRAAGRRADPAAEDAYMDGIIRVMIAVAGAARDGGMD